MTDRQLVADAERKTPAPRPSLAAAFRDLPLDLKLPVALVILKDLGCRGAEARLGLPRDELEERLAAARRKLGLTAPAAPAARQPATGPAVRSLSRDVPRTSALDPRSGGHRQNADTPRR